MNPVDLASLLCSRLCHDLMSPIGALNNGIELLAEESDPDMREKCLELLPDSARASANKIKVFPPALRPGGARAAPTPPPRSSSSSASPSARRAALARK